MVANQTEMTDAAYDSADCDMDGLTNNEEITGIDDPSTPNDPNGNTTDPQNPDSDPQIFFFVRLRPQIRITDVS